MTKLPRGVTSSQCIRALEKAGFYRKRQSGSHATMVRSEPFAMVIVPVHRKTLTPGTLRSIIRQAGMSVEEFELLL
jgi:predicted RNA binding protein YcfA (HicA-like mRNA interferase family)